MRDSRLPGMSKLSHLDSRRRRNSSSRTPIEFFAMISASESTAIVGYMGVHVVVAKKEIETLLTKV